MVGTSSANRYCYNAQTIAEGTPLCAECTEYEHAHLSLCEHLYKSWLCPAALWSHVHDLVRVISPLLQKIKQQQILIAGLCLININVLILIYLTIYITNNVLVFTVELVTSAIVLGK